MSQYYPSVSVELTPEFQQNLRELSKRYRSIRLDLEAVISELQTGNLLGDRVPGIGQGYAVFKLRVRNSNVVSVILEFSQTLLNANESHRSHRSH